MPLSKCSLPTVAAFAAILAACPARAESERLVELRDGSRIRVGFDPQALLVLQQEDIATGEARQRPIRFDEIARASFSPEPAMAKLHAIQGAVRALGSEVFAEREAGQAELIRQGRGFRAILEHRLATGRDAESRWRLQRILRELPVERLPESRLPYDTVRTETGEALEGDFGEWSLEVTYRGQRLPLSRRTVTAIRREDDATPDGIGLPQVRRLRSPDDAAFAGGRSIDFGADPRGVVPEIGDDIGMRFADWGVTLQTSIPGKYVSVNDYEVAGPSRGLSAATHDPLYEGTVTVRFCVPGNPGIPAGVQAVGVWLAIVVRDGTALQAYDVSGNLIEELRTESGPSEFLALRSVVPIHAIRLVPNATLDPNYTMDDLVFSPPQALDNVGVEGHSTVRFRNGDRLICSALADGADGALVLEPTGFPAVRITAGRAEIAAVHAPLGTETAAVADDLFWAEVAGGSRLLVKADAERHSLRFPELRVDELSLVGMWGRSRIRVLPPPDEAIRAGEAIVVDGDSVRRMRAAGLGETWIRIEGDADPADVGIDYATSPPVWFAQPGVRLPGTAALTFASGEVIMLQGESGFRLETFSAAGAVISRGDLRWKVPFAEIAELRFGEP